LRTPSRRLSRVSENASGAPTSTHHAGYEDRGGATGHGCP
jgi:hypothetical protein